MQHLPEVAIVVSLASLFFSLRNNRFNQEFRKMEAKIEMLSVISEASLNHARSLALHQDILRIVKQLDNHDALKMATSVETFIHEFGAGCDRIYALTKSLERNDVISGYMEILPDLRQLRDKSIELHEAVSRVHTACMASRTKA